MKINNKMKFTILIIILLIFIIYIFSSFKMEKVLNSKINYHDIKSIEIVEYINAYMSNDYTIKDTEQILSVYKNIGNLRVRRCIFVPEFYSIQQYKTYRINFIGVDKVLILSMNTNQSNDYISIDDKTYKIFTTEKGYSNLLK